MKTLKLAMKNLIIITLFIFSVNLLNGQIPGEKKWKENIIQNKIESQVQWNHKYEKNKPKRTGYKNYTKKFDRFGNIIEEIYYQSGTIDQKLSYKYDNHENKVEYVNYKGNESKILFKQNITYDNSTRKIGEDRFDGIDRQIIKYDYKNNKLSRITRSDILGEIKHKRIFNYSRNTCTISIFDDSSIKVGKIINKYDNNDNIIESKEYDGTGNIKEQYFYKFQNNLVKEKVKYVLGNFNYKEKYKYDTRGNLIKIIKEEPKGKIFVSNLYKYDTKGNLIEEEWYDNNPKENSKRTYYYNDKGILEKVDVYYALYKYRIQYRYKYTFY